MMKQQMLTEHEKNKLTEIYGAAIAEVYDYVLQEEKSRSGAGTPKAAKVKLQVKYNRNTR